MKIFHYKIKKEIKAFFKNKKQNNKKLMTEIFIFIFITNNRRCFFKKRLTIHRIIFALR